MSTIKEVLDRKGHAVISVSGSTKVLDAIGRMSGANIGAVLIQDGDQPVGIFTERDYLRKIALEGRASGKTPVSTVMSSPLMTAPSTESTRTAMEMMTERRCRHLVIVDDGQMVGIVSMGDLVKHLLIEAEAEVEQLSSYIAGSY